LQVELRDLDHLIDRQRLEHRHELVHLRHQLEVAPPEGGDHLRFDRERLRIVGRQAGDAMDLAQSFCGVDRFVDLRVEIFELRLQGALDLFDERVRQLGAPDHRDEIHVQLHTVQVTHEQPLHFRAMERRLDLATCRFHATKVHLRFIREQASVDAAFVKPDGCVAVRHCDALRRVTPSAPIIARHSVL